MTGKEKNAAIIALLLFFLSAAGPVQAGPASGNYEITSSVFSGGGGRAASASYRLEAVLGQPSPLTGPEVTVESESYSLAPGFLQTLAASCRGLDREPDGDVDGSDLAGLALAGPPAANISAFALAFGRDDCLGQPPEEEEGYY